MEAVVLAGGKGTRLRQVVQDVPKPMAPVNGRPFLEYILDELILHGFTRVILSTGYMAGKISDHFGSSYKNLEVVYSHEEEPLGTGGGIKLALDKCTSSDVLVMNGDSIFKFDITEFLGEYRKKQVPMGMALMPMSNFDRYGAVKVENDRVIGFQEKQQVDFGVINTGIYLMNREFFDQNSPSGAFSFESDYLQKKVGQIFIYAHVREGYFIDIGIPEDYSRAQTELG